MKRHTLIVLLLLLVTLPVQAQIASMRRNAEKIASALYFIQTHYVDTVDMDKAVDTMLEGLMNGLDPHSSYIPRDKVQSTNESLDGSFEGVGIEYVMLADTLTIQSVISGGPSEAVGLRAGDKIVAVDGENVAGVHLAAEDMRKRLRGPKGSKVSVTVLRNGELQDYVIRRDTIPIESVEAAYAPEPGITYIKLSRFAQNTDEEFLNALGKVSEHRPDGMIIDLRGNGGGFMHVAVFLANLFLEEGQVIVRTEGNGIDRVDKAQGINLYPDGPLVVLVDESSASASEILSGALQDWDRAVIVGRRTFGKGLVQQQYALPDGSEIRLTVARYHTPSGRVVQSPYQRGHRDEYYQAIQARYDRGESFSLDSIALPDSLKYQTLKLGRTVYGGGGILPDVFIPYDTTGINRFFMRAVSSGRLSEFAYEYADKHRSELAADDFAAFEKKWEKREDSIFSEMIAFFAEKGLEAESEEELAECASLLKIRLEALLARSALGSTAYWQVINRYDDPAFQEALRIVKEWNGAFPALP